MLKGADKIWYLLSNAEINITKKKKKNSWTRKGNSQTYIFDCTNTLQRATLRHTEEKSYFFFP
jgi:hypothetical protein